MCVNVHENVCVLDGLAAVSNRRFEKQTLTSLMTSLAVCACARVFSLVCLCFYLSELFVFVCVAASMCVHVAQ